MLSTCNRSELYGVRGCGVRAAITETMEEFFTSFHGIPRAELDGRIYRWTGPDARAASVPRGRGARFDAARRSRNPRPASRRVRQGARTRLDRAGAESRVSRRARSGQARALGNGSRRAADVRCACGREARRARLRQSQGPRRARSSARAPWPSKSWSICAIAASASLRVANRSFDRAAELAATHGRRSGRMGRARRRARPRRTSSSPRWATSARC